MADTSSSHVRVVRVIVVSPGDVMPERKRLAAVVERLNRRFAPYFGCLVALWRWETDAHPGLHLEGPQGLIDDAMGIEDADLVIGIFWSRFGTPTLGAGSGTEHELLRARSAWERGGRPQVMVYFCERPSRAKDAIEAAQLHRLLAFRDGLPEQQLWWRYTTVNEFAETIRDHLEDFIMDGAALSLEAAVTSDPETPREAVVATHGLEIVRRREIGSLDATELARLRKAFGDLMGMGHDDKRGYAQLAGLHGLPLPMYQQNSTPRFLAWNRLYLAYFERALCEQAPQLGVPWWDWAQADPSEIPAAFADLTTPAGDPNPLYDAEIPPQGREPDTPSRTTRAATTLVLPTPDDVEQVLERAHYFDFASQLEHLHAMVHVAVGGTLGRLSTGAYDPLFWSLHANVDRLWAMWQQRHPDHVLPDTLLDEALPPFGLTVRDAIDTHALGYEYG